MDPTIEQLAQYLVQELGRGVPEHSLRASLLRHGWSQGWVDAAFEYVQQRFHPGYSLPAPGHAVQPTSQRPKTQTPMAHTLKRRHRFFAVLIVVLLTFGLLCGIALLVAPRLGQAAAERQVRDTMRQQDLAQLLSDLSDFYVKQNQYPTRDQLNDREFRSQNSLRPNIQDPTWSSSAAACTKNGHAVLAPAIEAHCYAYKATTSEGGACNNTNTPCTRMTLTVLLEKDNALNRVTFDRNNEIEE